MKKRIGLTLAVGLMASVPSLRAATACATNTTVAALLALNAAGGCTVGDKIFTNFSYTTGGVNPAANVNALLLADTGTLNFGWDIAPNTGSFISNFSFGFTVAEIASAVCPGISCPIAETQSTMFPASSPLSSNSQVVTVTLSAGPSPVTLNNSSPANNSVITNISPAVTALSMNAVSSGLGVFNPILDLSLRAGEAVIPEPVTYVLTGSGLIGLALLRRLRTSKS